MHSFPLKDPKPDYEERLAVLAGSKDPKKVHNIEMLIDEEGKSHIVEHYFGEKN